MRKEQFVNEINAITKLMGEFSEDNNSFGELFGTDSIAENVFCEHFYDAINMAIDSLSIRARDIGVSNDHGSWCSWYIYEGVHSSSDGAIVVVNDEEFLCDSPEVLWKIIKSDREQG